MHTTLLLKKKKKNKTSYCGDQNLIAATQTAAKTTPGVRATKTMLSRRPSLETTN
jgi:hypothetical protein